MNNSQKKLDFDAIIEAYNNICTDGTQKNIYDRNQGIIVIIEYYNNSYLVSNIINDITEINWWWIALRGNLKCFSYIKNDGKGADKNWIKFIVTGGYGL